MEDWTPDRIHRFKNILAFLIATFSQSVTFKHQLESRSPAEIEANFMKYLGPDLPTAYEYCHGLNSSEVSLFDHYCDLYTT